MTTYIFCAVGVFHFYYITMDEVCSLLLDVKNQLLDFTKLGDNIQNQIKIQNEKIQLLEEAVRRYSLNDNKETVQNAALFKNENFLNQMKEEVNADKRYQDERGAKPKLKKTSSLQEKSTRKIIRVRRSSHTVPSDKDEQRRFNSFRRECLSKAIQWHLVDLLRAASELEENIVFPKWLCKADSKFVMEGNNRRNMVKRFLNVLMKKDFGTMQEWLQHCGFDVNVLKQVWVTFEEFSNMNGSELKCFNCRLIENIDVLEMGDYLFSADVIGQEMYRKILESKLPVGAQEGLWKQLLLECEKFVQRYIVICAIKVGLTDMQRSASDRVKPVYDSLLSDIEDYSEDLFLCKCSERCSQVLHPVSCLKAVSMAGVYLSPPAHRKREMSTSSEDVESNVSPSSSIESTSDLPYEVTKPKSTDTLSKPVEDTLTKIPVETASAGRRTKGSVSRRGTSNYSLETQKESRSLCKRRDKKIEVSSLNYSSSDSLDGEKRSAVQVKNSVKSMLSHQRVEKNPNVINAKNVVLYTGPQYHLSRGQNSCSPSDS